MRILVRKMSENAKNRFSGEDRCAKNAILVFYAQNGGAMQNIPRPEYPRPQMRRDCWQNLNGRWEFEIDNAKLKRAGLDYWHQLDITYYENSDEFFEKNKGEEMFFFSTKAPVSHVTAVYPKRVFLVFGKETKGLPEDLLKNNIERCVRIPMRNGLRSLNLSNSAAIAVYEVLRQREFDGLLEEGAFPER